MPDRLGLIFLVGYSAEIMYIRQYHKTVDGKRQAYWALVESVRTERGPRQRIVSWLGTLDEAGRLGVLQAAEQQQRLPKSSVTQRQLPLFEYEEDLTEPRWVRVNTQGIRVENVRAFGGPWLALKLIEMLQLDQFLEQHLPIGKEQIPWSMTSLILVIARLLNPSSELHISEQWYDKTALADLLGVPADRVDDNRLYRALDKLLPSKEALEVHLKNRLGDLFQIEYDLLLYDVTSTYFEGQAKSNPLAQRGYSRDQRSDCKQVCIGLVVSRCGLPLGYEIFAGNTADVTTVEEIVETMERRYGKSERIWVMDRGMVSEENLDFLRSKGRRYIVGTNQSMLKKFEQELLKSDWTEILSGLEVKICHLRSEDGTESHENETFILCRSKDRREKERAIVKRFADRIAQRLERMQARCEQQNRDPKLVSREIGRLLGQNSRASRMFEIEVLGDKTATIQWKRLESVATWQELSEGCYLLRSNVRDWTDEQLWKAYVQLTEAENAFRIQKSDLRIRPIWHQKEERVRAHIHVCFLAYVLWKSLGQLCSRAGLGDEPRRVIDELSEIRSMDVVMPTDSGVEIRTRCIATPTEHQKILLERLRWRLPKRIFQNQM